MNAFRLMTRVRSGAGSATGRATGLADDELPRQVPWRVASRSITGSLEVEHCGAQPLRAVRFALAGGGLLGVSLPRTVRPGERLRVVLRGTHADGAVTAADAMLVLRWFEPDGRELLWPVAL